MLYEVKWEARYIKSFMLASLLSLGPFVWLLM